MQSKAATDRRCSPLTPLVTSYTVDSNYNTNYDDENGEGTENLPILNRRPRTPSEVSFVENVGYDEWAEVESLAATRGEIVAPDETPTTRWFSWKTLWAYAGPGWLMSIAYVDPGNLESDLQAGAYAGYQLIWVLWWSTFMGFFLQVLAARLGVVSGKNLAEMCRLAYPTWTSHTLWVMTEIAIVGSDIQEVLGSAIAFNILFGIPLWSGCLVTAVDTFTFLLLHKFGIRKLEAFFVTLIMIMMICFFINFENGGINIEGVSSGFIPRVDRYAATQAVGILGAVIMPHNIFLHSGLVQSRAVNRRDVRKVQEANKYFCIESAMALFVSFLINLAVLGVFAQGFFSPDCSSSFYEAGTNTACIRNKLLVLDSQVGKSYGDCTLSNGETGTCRAIGLSQAGTALRGILHGYAEIVWAIGLLAAGQSSTMTGTYAGQFVMEGFLRLKIAPWKRVALTRCVALVPAMTVAIWSQQSSPGLSDELDELLNVLQSVQLPFALLPVLHFTSSTDIMGRFANGRTVKAIGWALTIVVCSINMYLVTENLRTFDLSVGSKIAFILIGILYFGFLFQLIKSDVREFVTWLRKYR